MAPALTSSHPIPPPADAPAFLAGTRLFRSLDGAGLAEVAGELEWLLVPGGEVVCRQGDEGDALFLVYSGRLAVVREAEGERGQMLGEVGRGESFGEVAVLTGRRRTATVYALRDVVIARLSWSVAQAVLARQPAALLALTRRLASLLDPMAPPERNRTCLALAVTPVGDAPPRLLEQIVAALAAHGPTLALTASDVDLRLGPGVAASAEGSDEHRRLAAWANAQEGSFRFIVYLADAAGSAWTRRCLRQADRVLVVAPAEAPPSLGALGPELARLEEDQGKQIEELVLVHAGALTPRGTAGWLGLRPFFRHHHLRAGDRGDFARLARFLDGSAVALVLGGGGARGFAHIGVVRALREAGVPIDRVGGTSMGAMIGAMVAAGLGWEEMVERNRRGWVQIAPQKVYTLPVISICSTAKADRMLDVMYGDPEIEDLGLDFFCVSVNITRAEVVVHRQGSLRRAIKATITLPGITPPMLCADGELLVDGGVLNNLPVDVMRRLGDGPIVASDVSAAVDLRADPSFTDPPTAWQFVRERLRRGGQPRPFPNILRLIHRAALLASDVYAKSAKREVELFLDIPMDGFDMFAMERIDELVEHGYRFTREALEKAPLQLAGGQPAPPVL